MLDSDLANIGYQFYSTLVRTVSAKYLPAMVWNLPLSITDREYV